MLNIPYSNETTFIDIEDGSDGNGCTIVGKRLSIVNKNGGDNSALQSMDASSSKPFTTTCLGPIEIKHKWIFNVSWVAVHILSIAVSCYYIQTSYHRWQSSPVVQAVSTSQVNYKNISFPAVTICWPNSFNQGYDFLDYINNCLDCEGCLDSLNNTKCNDTEMAMLAIAFQICFVYGVDNTLSKLLSEYVPQGIDGSKFEKYLEKLVPSCESDVVDLEIYDLKSRKNYTRCDGLMFEQFYSDGYNALCMTYNSLKHEDILKANVITPSALARQVTNKTTGSGSTWSFDNMMDFQGGLQTLPIYGLDALTIAIQPQERHFENICKDFEKNLALLFLHSPNEIPIGFMGETYVILREKMFLDLTVEPKITLAKHDLVQYTPQQRGCFFSDEKDLALFKVYTKNNCETECRANISLDVCGCLPYYYPRHNESVKVCLRQCVIPKYDCGCLPDCNYLTYGIKVQEGPKQSKSTYVQVDITLKDHTYYTTVRYSISSYAEFLAYSLGVLGAFLGFSVTCVWKLLYFGFIRLWTIIKVFKHKVICPLHQN